ncbi:hypothetical protein ACOZ35_03230 [Halorubrum xinjiangense]|uniref:hypothetical protein n=1 Tax=Halorubrum xinjiangense TaxID=261291 RepID=UPI003C6FE123
MLVLASIPLSAAAAAPVTTLDKDHALWTDDKKEQYRDSGLAKSVINAPDVTITASVDKDGCNARSLTHPDIAYDFLCIDYQEDISRTIRLHVPRGYFGLHNGVVESLEENGEARVSISPDEDYIIVHVEVDGPTKMTIPMSETGAVIQLGRETTGNAVEEFTGFGQAGDEWEYIEAGELSPDSGAYVINAPEGDTAKHILVEYQEEDTWARPGRSSDTYKPIYTVERDGVDNKLYVHATTADAPQVRYKLEPGPVDRIFGYGNELMRGPARVIDWFANLF